MMHVSTEQVRGLRVRSCLQHRSLDGSCLGSFWSEVPWGAPGLYRPHTPSEACAGPAQRRRQCKREEGWRSDSKQRQRGTGAGAESECAVRGGASGQGKVAAQVVADRNRKAPTRRLRRPLSAGGRCGSKSGPKGYGQCERGRQGQDIRAYLVLGLRVRSCLQQRL